MRKEIADIKAFQRAFECNVLPAPTMPAKEIQDLRVNLLQEELDELKQANADGDIVEALDAIVDIMYVLLGTACEYGIADLIAQAWDLVHASNMSKLDENGRPIRRADGKIIKPPTYKKVDLTPLFKTV